MFENFVTMLKRMKQLSTGRPIIFFHVSIHEPSRPEMYNARYGTWKEQSEMNMDDWDAILEGTKQFMSKSCLRSVKGTGRPQHAKSM